MTTRRFDAVISDIDGCLGPESADPLDAPALARIAEYNLMATVRKDRPVLTLCSGRPQPYAECMCRLLANTTLPVICEMGVWLYDPKDNRFIIDDKITPSDRAAVRDLTAWLESEYVPGGFVIQPGKTASVSLWHPDTPHLKQSIPAIKAAVQEKAWPFRVSSTVAWINFELTHVSKGTGIDRMMSMERLTKERVAGIGDTMGDMAIREHVSFFACPSNALDELKQSADYVSPYPEVHGVLDILERLR